MLTRKFRRQIITFKKDLPEFFLILLKYLKGLPGKLPLIEIHITDLTNQEVHHHSHKQESFNQIFRTFLFWIVPATIAVTGVAVITPVFAQLEDFDTRLSQYTVSQTPLVGSETRGEGGYEQIYYLFEDNKYFLTDEAYSHGAAVADHEKIAWMTKIDGMWQIFLYNLTTKQLLQLTHGGNNVDPKISGGKVVWQGWIDGTWQIFFYDGKTVAKLTSGDTSVNPDISGDYIVYSRKDKNNLWRGTGFSIPENKELDIAVGNEYKVIKLAGTDIKYGGEARSRFPLTIEDLFTLKLGVLQSTSSGASYESILAELMAAENMASSSAQVQGVQDINEVPISTESAEITLTPTITPVVGPSATVSATPSVVITPGI